MEIPRPGVKSELALSAYPTATATRDLSRFYDLHHTHGSARSLTHWVGQGIKPASLWILIGFIPAELQQELLTYQFEKFTYKFLISLYRIISLSDSFSSRLYELIIVIVIIIILPLTKSGRYVWRRVEVITLNKRLCFSSDLGGWCFYSFAI